MDAVVELRGLRLLCVCGALPEEQDRRQPYEFDLDLHGDVAAALSTDRLDDTIDYGAVLAAVTTVTDAESFQLFERMATRVGEAVVALDKVDRVVVTVRKLRPPVPQDLASAGIRVTVSA